MTTGAETTKPSLNVVAPPSQMAALVGEHDWASSPLGDADRWPQQLRTLVGVLLCSKQPMFLAWGAEQTLIYNDAYSEILANKHPAALGRPFLEVWSEIRADLTPIVDQAYRGEPVHMDDIELLMHRRGYAEEAHFAFSYTPIASDDREVLGFFCACMEITGQVMAERRLVQETARQRRLFEQAPGFITILAGPEHRFEFANQAYRRLFGDRDYVGRSVREAFPELEGQGFFEMLDRVWATGERIVADGVEARIDAGGGELRSLYLDFFYEPVTDERGEITGIFCEGYDVTARKRADEQLRLMVLELNHRVKNNLATVQSIASQTLRGTESLPAARTAFLNRIMALATAHDILTREQWDGAGVGEIAHGVLDPMGAAEGRVRIGGPKTPLQARAALALSMAFHELGTNALKYGALSSAGGWVELTWTNRDGELELTWREHGGPPVTPPERTGFGSRLLARGLAAELGGQVELRFEPGGVQCFIRARLDGQPDERPETHRALA
ncbi:sensor histidine kinase [Phenylobacterium sp.]|jgi:PAS domain S-box-containing protein|uniref:sensor histidine kinase n=1 Tax=Phenylobacterium sp. TaxID=1871053 RepID=UPI002F927192